MAMGPKTQREQTLVVIAAVAFLLAGVYFWYVYKPTSAKLVIVRAHIDTLQTANKAAKSLMARRGSVEQIKRQAQRSEQALASMRRLVPLSNEVPTLLEQISTAARREGFDIADIQPEAKIEGDLFDTHRFKMATLGGYHEIASFLAGVGSLSRIVAPINLQLTAPSNPNAAASHKSKSGTIVEARFEVQTYVERQVPGSQDAPPPRKGN